MVKERVDSLAWLRKQVEVADKDLLRELSLNSWWRQREGTKPVRMGMRAI